MQSALCAKPRLAVLPARPLAAARWGASAVCRYKVRSAREIIPAPCWAQLRMPQSLPAL